jgi:hypothetical protein
MLVFSNPSSGGSTGAYVLTVEQLATGAYGGLDIQSAGTGSLFRVRDTTATAADVFTIADGGAATFKSQTNSVSGFQIQNASSATIFQVDTSNSVIRAGDGPTYTTVSQTNTLLESTNSPGLYGTSVAIGADGLPIIAYYENVSGNMKVMHCGNASCSSGNVTTVADAGGNGGDSNVSRLEIAVAPDGLAVISYHDSSVGALKVYKCADTNCTTGTATSVDTGGGRGMFNQIAISADGLPIISYQGDYGDSLKVVKCGNATCSSGNTITTLTASSGLGAGRYNDIAIGIDGLPVIMDDEAVGNDMVFFKCGNAACSSGNVKTTLLDGDLQDDASMTIGSDGLPIMVYRSVGGNSIAFLKCGTIDCTSGNTVSSQYWSATAATSTIRIGSVEVGVLADEIVDGRGQVR